MCSPLGASWDPLGASWEPLGASWGRLGSLLGASWGHLGASTGIVCKEAKRSYVSIRLRCVLEPPWCHLGAVLGPSWAILGPSRGHPGASWALLGPSWRQLGRLKSETGEVAKTLKNLRFLKVFGLPRGSKTRPSWAKLESRGGLELSCSDLGGSLEEVGRHLPILRSSWAILRPSWAS